MTDLRTHDRHTCKQHAAGALASTSTVASASSGDSRIDPCAAATAEATALPGATSYHLRNATWSIAWTTSGGSNYLEAHGGEPHADRGHKSRVAAAGPWRRGAPAAAAGTEAGALGGRRGARVRGMLLLLEEGGGPLPAHRRGHPARRRRSSPGVEEDAC
jgi:hypothetical protein